MRRRGLWLIAVLALGPAGCMVGPDYVKPAVIIPQSFKEADGWKVARPGDALSRGRWWEIFGDAELNALADQVADANQDLQVAEARFREAGFRAVPNAIVRRSAFIGRGVVLMPCFVNVGAYVGENTMIDTWATV